MKKSDLRALIIIVVFVSIKLQFANAQDKTEQWPGVTVKVLSDNEKVNISEVTLQPGAVADWHSHPQYTTYAVTDAKMRVEIEGKETVFAEMKAGQASWSPAVKHKVTNTGNSAFTVIVTEIK